MKQILVAIGVVAALATTATAQSTFDPDCVLYYDFETLDGSGKVVNLANPGTMNGSFGTNTGTGGTLKPEIVEATPAVAIRQSMTSFEYEASEKALQNYRDGDTSRTYPNYDGYLVCFPSDTEWFSKTNFTVELFFKTDDGTQTYVPFFCRKGGANVQVQLGINATKQRLAVNVSTNTTKQVQLEDTSDFTLGEWHHAALVVDQTGETKTLKAYLDRKCVITITLDANLTAENSAYKTDWFVAGKTIGASFGGLIDSVRVTLRALEPEEFLTTRPYASGSTITYISFDDETPNASADYGTLREGKYQGSIEPTYSDIVPGPIIRDGEGGEILKKHNAKSISFPDTTDHSWVSYGSHNNNPLDVYNFHSLTGGQYRTSGTIEFWMKSSQTDADYDTVLWGGFARTTNAVGAVTSYQHSLIRFNNAHRLEFGFNASGTWRGITAKNVDVLDGKWHHVAFTFKPAPTDSSKMVATGYIDYEQVDTITCDGQLRLENNGYFDLRFAGQHGSDFGKKNFGGLIDELRFSDGALEPSQFLRAENNQGLTIIFK